jgi:signal transduction histidine kinase
MQDVTPDNGQWNGPWHGPPPWHGPSGHQDDAHGWGHRIRGWRNRGDGQPLRRQRDDRVIGGVAAGIAAWRGFNPTTVRVVLAVAALITAGWAVPFYVIAWLIVPAQGEETTIASRARHDSRGIAIALALASLLIVFLALAGALNDGVIEKYGWAQVVSVPVFALIWRNASADEQVGMRRLVLPLDGRGATGKAARRAARLRIAGSVVLLGAGLAELLSLHGGTQLLRPLGGFLFVTAGLVLLLGPWWLRIARDLMVERQARARAEERADIAAHMHDSVLQTLALIQRRAEDPQAVVQLARAQERDLRSWLFEGRAPGEADASFAEGVRQIQRDVEALHGVPVEVVTVGDCPLDEHVAALLAAGREATVNAAKWSGAAVVSVFAEVEGDKVNVAVRDRGKGFDPAAVPGDRKGVAESIRGRMSRHGGEATVQSAPGEGTKVTLTMPRTAPSEPAGRAQAAGEGKRR